MKKLKKPCKKAAKNVQAYCCETPNTLDRGLPGEYKVDCGLTGWIF